MKFRGRACYQAEVEMKTVALCYQRGLDLTVHYCFKKADLQAGQTDYDYLEQPFLGC